MIELEESQLIQDNAGLTLNPFTAMIAPHSHKTKAGNRSPHKATTGHYQTWFFCTHQKYRRHYAVYILFWWGVLSSPLKGWPDLAGTANLIHPTAQRLAAMGGGLSLLQGQPQ